jgi:hypothetical protein
MTKQQTTLTKAELYRLYALSFSERSLVSMRCYAARHEPKEVRDQIIRTAINGNAA